MAQGPYIGETFIISQNFENRPAIQVLDEGEGNSTRMIAVNVWHPQGRGGKNGEDLDPVDFSALFFGKAAEIIEKNFGPGDKIKLSGNLKITTDENNGQTYVNKEIQDANFEFPLPGTNSGGGNQSQGSSGSSSEQQGSMPSSSDMPGGDGMPSSGVPDAQKADPPSDQPAEKPSSEEPNPNSGGDSSSTEQSAGPEAMPTSL